MYDHKVYDADAHERLLRTCLFSVLCATEDGVSNTKPAYKEIYCRDAFNYIVMCCARGEQPDDDTYSCHGYNNPLVYDPRITADDGSCFLLLNIPGKSFREYREGFKKFAVPIFQKTGAPVPTIHYSRANSGRGFTGVVVRYPSVYALSTFTMSFLTQLIRGCADGTGVGQSAVSIWDYYDDDDMFDPGTNVPRPAPTIAITELLAPYILEAGKRMSGQYAYASEYYDELLDYGVYALYDNVVSEYHSEIFEDSVNFLREKLSN